MEIETLVEKGKGQKMNVDQTRDVEMEDIHASKKENTQEIEVEELGSRLVETRAGQPGFQVTLEDPLQTISSSYSEVAILSSKGSTTDTEPSWPTGKPLKKETRR